MGECSVAVFAILNGFQISGAPLTVQELDVEAAREIEIQNTIAEVSLAKIMEASTGGDVTITIAALNTGPNASVLTTINDRIPPDLVVTSCHSSGGEACTRVGDLTTVNLESLAVGQTKTVIIVACSTAATIVSNTALVASLSTDPDFSNNFSVASVNPPPPWTAGQSYVAGERVTFQGMVFVARQAHTALPTWQPTQILPSGIAPLRA